VATTCATSWTAAPAKSPNVEAVIDSRWPMGGSVKIDRVPHSVTRERAYATSSGSASALGSIAAIADAPQIA
jgi:hypothetical protein